MGQFSEPASRGPPSIFLLQDPGHGRSSLEPRNFWAGKTLACEVQLPSTRSKGLCTPIQCVFPWPKPALGPGLHSVPESELCSEGT